MVLSLILGLSACGKKDNSNDNKGNNSNNNSSSVGNSNSNNSDKTDNSDNTDSSNTQKDEEIEFIKDIDDVVVTTDEYELRVTKVECHGLISHSSYYGDMASAKAFYEFTNKSDKKIELSLSNVIKINGLDEFGHIEEEKQDNGSLTGSISVTDSRMIQDGELFVTNIVLFPFIYREGSYDSEALDIVTINPLGEENVKLFERQSEPTDVVLYDNENIRITLIYIDRDYSDINLPFKLYVENKTDMRLKESLTNIKINGKSCSELGTYLDIAESANKFDEILFNVEELEKSGLKKTDDFNTIEFSVKIEGIYPRINNFKYDLLNEDSVKVDLK